MLREQGMRSNRLFGAASCGGRLIRRMLTSDEEIDQIADGIYSLAELEELFIKRRKEELGQL